MNLTSISDKELILNLKESVQIEQNELMKILHQLREVERRRLFSELGFASLFEFAVRELKYSEGRAGRRIAAMRLIKEVPEVEAKIASGELSLSNVQQAQSLFREMNKSRPERPVEKREKLEVLAKLENKSTRDGQKELLKIQPLAALPKERERVVSETATEIKFLMSDKLKAKLEQVRSLLGVRGTSMSYAELFESMSELSLEALKAQRFGKKRAAEGDKKSSTPAPELESSHGRYLSKALKFKIWERDQGRCTECQSTRNLNYDHIHPIALGGKSTLENLRLLCFHCNQRAGAKVFGHRENKSLKKLGINELK